MLALAAYREGQCPGCHGQLAETTNPDNEGRYRAEAIRCHKCTSMAAGSTKIQGDHLHAVLYTAELRRG